MGKLTLWVEDHRVMGKLFPFLLQLGQIGELRACTREPADLVQHFSAGRDLPHLAPGTHLAPGFLHPRGAFGSS